MTDYKKNKEILEYVLKQFELAGYDASKESYIWERCNDNFAGFYYDDQGRLVFCTVNVDVLDKGKYAENVIHKKCKYSYRYLHIVQMMIVDSFMVTHQGVCSVGIVERENHVRVELKDDYVADSTIEKLVKFLEERHVPKEAVTIQRTRSVNKLL